jgi:cytochrome b561
MHFKNTKNRYGIISIVLHWLMAILIIGLFVLGKYMIDLDLYHPLYHKSLDWHKEFGIMMFLLLLIRILWRITNISPEPLDNYKKYEIISAKTTHFALYILLVIAAISGYFISTSAGAAIEFFGIIQIPAVMLLNETQIDIVARIHDVCVHLLLLLFVLHMAAALKHHFFNRDITLKRMFFSQEILK